ncbi:MAG TPA: hypothetical protein VF557_11865 [Jatrophihabitans sp.]|uniref:hypothetical protein n=1 Tax=Jatrophihabitans sp. TaxID=1932789 RepID=UPI002F1836BC
MAGLPASGISAVTVTLSMPTPAAAGSISVFPSGTAWSGAATISFAAASTQQNTVTAKLGGDGAISVRNNTASALQLVADVVGYYTVGPAVPGGFQPVSLQRLFDTRAAGSQPLAAGATATVQVAGRGAIPASNVSAGVVNLTVLSPAATGSVSVFPAGASWDGSTTASFATGQTEQSMLTAQLGGNGAFSVRNNTGTALHLVVDLAGYYVAGSPLATGGYLPMTRDRIFDSRTWDDDEFSGPFTAGGLRTVPTLGVNVQSPYTGPKTPHWGLRAETILLTVVSPSQSGSISVFAGDRAFDGKAMVSFPAGRTVQRLVTVRIPPEGTIRIRNNSSVTLSVIADVVGYFAGVQNRLHLTTSALIDPDRNLTDVSCTSDSFCMAVTGSGQAFRYDGSSWSAGLDPQAGVVAVSCTSPTFCMGIGHGGASVSTYDGSQWSAPVVVNPEDDDLRSISCASASFCVAMSHHISWATAYVFNGAGWDTGTALSQAKPTVSCPTASFCVSTAGDSSDWLQWDGSHWSRIGSGASAPYPVPVSCVSSTFCQSASMLSSSVWDGVDWRRAPTPVNHYLSSVSCPAAFACVVADENQLSVWDGAEWSMPIASTDVSIFGSHVSCPTVDFCMVVAGRTAYRLNS